MSKLQVLLSAMNLEDEKYIDNLKITGDTVVINQCNHEDSQTINRTNIEGNTHCIKYICSTERGLSRSRNMAIDNADADICILCDNDVVYEADYKEKIISAFERFKDADAIVFYIKRKEKPVPNFPKEKRMGYLSVLKIFSPEIAFRRKSVENIRFNESFGAGSGKYIMGEENLFLYDLLKAHKKIYYVPVKIAELTEVESTWFDGYDEKFFVSRGANYGAMTKTLSLLLILQFAIRKRSLYSDTMTMHKAVCYMLKGRKQYIVESKKTR